MHLNRSSAKWRQFCLGLKVLTGTEAIIVFSSASEVALKYPRCFNSLAPEKFEKKIKANFSE